MSAQELVDIFDESYQHRGIAERSLAYNQGLWLHTFHCWILQRKHGGQLILQKRTASKKLFPNYLDSSAAGHLDAGEKPIDGVREVQEELGLVVDKNKLTYLGIRPDTLVLPDKRINKQFCHVYFYETEESFDDMTIEDKEVSGVYEMNIKAGLDLFSGKINQTFIRGVEYSNDTNSWKSAALSINRDSFIPHVDAYYYKIFILADRLLRGESHLVI